MSDKNSLENIQHTVHACNARELLLKLFDENTFLELDKYSPTPVCVGTGFVNGTIVCAFAQDGDNNNGAMDEKGARKIKKAYELAVKNGCPIVGIFNSNGGKIIEGAKLLSAYSEILAKATKLSGVVPQISIVNGVSAGAQALITTLSDFVIMTKDAELFLTAPFVAKDSNELSGSAEVSAKSGVSAITTENSDEAIEKAKTLLGILPKNNLDSGISAQENSDDVKITSSLSGVELINAISSNENSIELYKDFGDSAKTVIGSLDWHTVAYVCVNGKLTADDTVKIAKLVSFADAFSLPVITFIDTEGFEHSSKAEISGSIRDSARLAQVYANATTAKISVITGKAYSSAYIALAGKNAGIDISFAWEQSIIAAMAPQAAVNFLYADEISNSDNPKQTEKDLINKYINENASAYSAAENGLVDSVISPQETKTELIKALDSIDSKRVCNPAKKHVNFIF